MTGGILISGRRRPGELEFGTLFVGGVSVSTDGAVSSISVGVGVTGSLFYLI